MDEPTAGLDVLAREEVFDMLRDYMIPGGRSILISSHISGDLEGFCDDFYMIDQGRVVMHEDTDELLDHYGIIKVRAERYETMDKKWLLRKSGRPMDLAFSRRKSSFTRRMNPVLPLKNVPLTKRF